ncbi:NAD-dependent succinate-semialdehyde dehydrogenase [Sporosarcina highlanderae]|uniref:Aldehyde dehydrogenase n=1 Tax=Sporosarcina highlanderae TaxID=3035916 RepID=A0ABT8JVR5_9BACL|nr:NAD-dependent succinate-semialdehyde dehydrogenase [Sporosarcina highlanderae]MDN4609184.1 NAD-dependent succinate-semialdehyde dehydrogenase [Sporosarcina highlanderae]
MYINGEWIGEQLEQFEVINPANEEVIAMVAKGGEKEACHAVEAAYNAFETWSKLTAEKRGKLLANWFRLIETEAEELAEIMTLEQGKPFKEALNEVHYANSFISWYAEEGKRVYGEIIPSSHENKRILVQKQPVGVVAAITPWNFPAAMITRKVAPALAAGCTVVIKPAEATPLTALKLAELAERAEIPAGVINVVTGHPQEIGDAWLKDDRVRKITFTGSTKVGKHLMRSAADTVKLVSLELGGNAPFIVMEDADLTKTIEGVMASKFRNAGQTCVCTNRIYVHESMEKAFTEKLVEAIKGLKVGVGIDRTTDIGPLINLSAVEKVKSLVNDARDKGGEVLLGGDVVDIEKGFFMMPTVIANVNDEMLCMSEEVFGPVASIATFRDEDEVIRRANATPYGLAAYLFTENLSKALRLSERLEFGIVGLNDGAPSIAQAPFGGFKESGLGREGGHYGISEFLEVKYISIGI